MNGVLYYLLQMIAVSGLLYGYYHFFLRNTKFHFYNRYYLVTAGVLSIIIPFLNIPVYFSPQQTDSSAVLHTLTLLSYNNDTIIRITESGRPGLSFTSTEILYVIYLLLCAALLARIILSILKINRIRRSNPAENLSQVLLITTDEPGTPFSFFRWLFWNRNIDLNSDKGQQIFRHELYHIRQKHSLDAVFMELLTAILWVNPFFHLMKKELQTIHEFLADQAVVTENKEWDYAELLLMQALQTRHKLVTPFFQTQIKRRIAMITSSKQPQYQYLRKLMVLPLFVFLTLLFAFTYKKSTSEEPSIREQRKSPETVSIRSAKETLTSVPAMKNMKTDTAITPTKKNKLPEEKNIVELPVGLNESKAPLIVVDGVIQIPKAGVTLYNPFPDGIAPSDIQSITVLKDKSGILKYGKQAANGVIEIITKKPAPIEIIEERANDTVPSGRNNIVFEVAETPASFPLGMEGWRKYLQRNMKASIPVENGAPAGTYQVRVRFIVNTDGTISDIVPLTSHGFGMEEEVIKLIKLGPRWKPATQNGKVVRAYTQQPVTFVVEKELPVIRETVVEGYPLKNKETATDTKEKEINNNNLKEIITEGYPSAKKNSGQTKESAELQAAEQSGSLYPNPATNRVSALIQSKNAGTGLIQVLNTAGTIVITQRQAFSKGVNTIDINTSSLAPGQYIVKITGIAGMNRTFKLVKN